jgi:hypothetical protein
MKRKPKPKHYKGLSKFFPLFFWYECEKCKEEFRREQGWVAETEPFVRFDEYGAKRYLCKNCAPDFETANKYFLNREWDQRSNKH